MRKFILLLVASLVTLGSASATTADWIVPDNIYTWWVRPHAAVYGGELYFGGVDRAGRLKINKVASDRSLSSFTLATREADDHNVPSVCQLPNGKILAMYTRHYLDKVVRYRISSSANDISAFAPEATLSASGIAAYTQCWVDSNDRVHLFYRVALSSWVHRYSDDNGVSWSPGKIFLTVGGSEYLYIATRLAGGTTIRLGIAGHPINSADHRIYYAEIDTASGDMSAPGGPSCVNLYDSSAAAAPSDFEVVFTPTHNARLFDIGGAAEPQVLFASFSNTRDAQYREARRTAGAWPATTVVDAGSPMENPVGDNFYFAGMAATDDVDSIYVIREDAATRNWPMERYTHNGSWTVADTLLTGDWRHYAENYRPIVPLNADANFPVISLRGAYQVPVDFYSTGIVIDPTSGEPPYSKTVLHSEAFAGTPGSAIGGWSVLVKSATSTGETLTHQDTRDYFGGTYGELFHTGGSAVLWGVTGSSAQDVELRVDGRINKANGAYGLVARWIDSSNRIVCYVNFSNNRLEIVERVNGVNFTSSAAFTGLTSTIGSELRLVVNGASATAYLYRNGVQLATTSRVLSATPVAGAYGVASSVAVVSPADVKTQIQRFLVTAP